MLVLAVLAQALAVVRGDDHQRRVAQSRTVDPVQQALELAVRVRDLARVEVAREALGEGRGRIVGRVGIEHMDPNEEGRAPRRVQPFQRPVHDLAAPPLAAVAARGDAARARERVVVHVEAPVEPRVAGDGIGTDEAAGGVAARLQEGGQGGRAGIQRLREVVADPVLVGQAAGEEGDVRGPRLGHVGDGVQEQHAFARQAVDGGGRAADEAVGAHAVGAQGVDGDEEQVRRGRGRRGEEDEGTQHLQSRLCLKRKRPRGRPRGRERSRWTV